MVDAFESNGELIFISEDPSLCSYNVNQVFDILYIFHDGIHIPPLLTTIYKFKVYENVKALDTLLNRHTEHRLLILELLLWSNLCTEYVISTGLLSKEVYRKHYGTLVMCHCNYSVELFNAAGVDIELYNGMIEGYYKHSRSLSTDFLKCELFIDLLFNSCALYRSIMYRHDHITNIIREVAKKHDRMVEFDELVAITLNPYVS